ncbi:MAG: glycosyltransferase [Syntrophaceae bacterium]|nr:glycosyltransferase [Syntrophaceae bacterium]
MKIIYIIHQFYPMHYTGTEKFLLNLSSSIQRNGHSVKVITYSFYEDSFYSKSKGNILLHEFLYKGIPVIAYKYKQMPPDMDYALESNDLTEIADDILQAEKPDLLHVAHPVRTAEFMNAAIRACIPYVFTLTDFWMLCPKSILFTSQGSLCSGPLRGDACRADCPEYSYESIVHRLEKSSRLLSAAHCVIAPSRFLGGIFQKEFPDINLRYIPYGIDYTWIKRNSKRYGTDAARLNFTYAGQLAYHKGVHVLIEAFKRISSGNVTLNLYGSGPSDHEHYLKKISANDPRIVFKGVYSENQVGEIMKDVDVITIPSNWHENNTIVMREALACNVPVVVSSAGGMTEVIRDGENGFIFNMGDTDHLYQVLSKIIEEPFILNKIKSSPKALLTAEQEAFAYLQEYQSTAIHHGKLASAATGKSVYLPEGEETLTAPKAFGSTFNGRLFPDGSKRKLILNALLNYRLSMAKLKYHFDQSGIGGAMGAIRIALNGGSVSTSHVPFLVKTPSLNVSPLLDDECILDEKPGISVLIPTFNEAGNLLRLLSAIRNQKGFKNIEIVVVDSGSTDDTVKLAKEFDARIVEIKPDEFTYSYARNLGAESASHDVVLFTSADALPSSDLWLYSMCAAIDKDGVTAVSCLEIPRSDADLFIRVVLYLHEKHILKTNNEDKTYSMPDERDPASLRRHAQLTSVALLIGREDFLKYRFRHIYAEDLDLGVRLLADGRKIALLASNPVIHSHNRPPYFHLKRSYVDTLVIADILGEELESGVIHYNELVGDIVAGYQTISSLCMDDIFSGRECIPVSELEAIADQIKKESQTKPLERYLFIRNEYTDPQFDSFLERIFEQYNNDPDRYQSRGLILNGPRGVTYFLKTAMEYLKITNDQVDLFLMNDFIAMVYKSFAQCVGIYAALCSVNDESGNQSFLEWMKDELMDRRIIWEKKT